MVNCMTKLEIESISPSWKVPEHCVCYSVRIRVDLVFVFSLDQILNSTGFLLYPVGLPITQHPA